MAALATGTPQIPHTHPAASHSAPVHAGMEVLGEGEGAGGVDVRGRGMGRSERVLRPDGLGLPSGSSRCHGVQQALHPTVRSPCSFSGRRFDEERSASDSLMQHSLDSLLRSETGACNRHLGWHADIQSLNKNESV